MDIDILRQKLYEMNEDELFYQKYYEAGKSPASLKRFLNSLDKKDVLERHLLIPEFKESIPPAFLDSYFFDPGREASIVLQKHNRYSPAILHYHTFFEMAYMYSGSCTQVISGQTIHMKTGDLCIIPPEIEHSVSVFDDSILINVMLRRDNLHEIFSDFLNIPNILSSFFLNHIYAEKANDYLLIRTGQDPYLKESFVWMYWECMNRQAFYSEAIAHTLLLDMYLIARSYLTSVQMPIFGSRTDVQRYALIQYIQANYKEVTLANLSDRFHYTNEYTSRLIKELTGMTFTDILRKIRLEKAEDLLENTTLSVAAAAESVGYATTEHFIRQFKKYTGLTPSEFRKKSSERREAASHSAILP